LLNVRLSAFDLRGVGATFFGPLTSIILINMIYKEASLSVKIFQNGLGDHNKGIILMVRPVQLSSDKKFLKLPS